MVYDESVRRTVNISLAGELTIVSRKNYESIRNIWHRF